MSSAPIAGLPWQDADSRTDVSSNHERHRTPDRGREGAVVAEAVRIGLEAAEGRNLEVFSPTIGRQLLERGLIDEIDLHVAPVLLGEGVRLLDNPGGQPIRLRRPGPGDSGAAVNLRYRPVPAGRKGAG
jgi:dihydrofolate reductase